MFHNGGMIVFYIAWKATLFDKRGIPLLGSWMCIFLVFPWQAMSCWTRSFLVDARLSQLALQLWLLAGFARAPCPLRVFIPIRQEAAVAWSWHWSYRGFVTVSTRRLTVLDVLSCSMVYLTCTCASSSPSRSRLVVVLLYCCTGCYGWSLQFFAAFQRLNWRPRPRSPPVLIWLGCSYCLVGARYGTAHSGCSRLPWCRGGHSNFLDSGREQQHSVLVFLLQRGPRQMG